MADDKKEKNVLEDILDNILSAPSDIFSLLGGIDKAINPKGLFSQAEELGTPTDPFQGIADVIPGETRGVLSSRIEAQNPLDQLVLGVGDLGIDALTDPENLLSVGLSSLLSPRILRRLLRGGAESEVFQELVGNPQFAKLLEEEIPQATQQGRDAFLGDLLVGMREHPEDLASRKLQEMLSEIEGSVPQHPDVPFRSAQIKESVMDHAGRREDPVGIGSHIIPDEFFRREAVFESGIQDIERGIYGEDFQQALEEFFTSLGTDPLTPKSSGVVDASGLFGKNLGESLLDRPSPDIEEFIDSPAYQRSLLRPPKDPQGISPKKPPLDPKDFDMDAIKGVVSNLKKVGGPSDQDILRLIDRGLLSPDIVESGRLTPQEVDIARAFEEHLDGLVTKREAIASISPSRTPEGADSLDSARIIKEELAKVDAQIDELFREIEGGTAYPPRVDPD